jgi:putative ABC transport system substrate-binding protein
MLRREVITLLGGAAAAWPLTARAQRPTPVVGYLRAGFLTLPTGEKDPTNVAFLDGLAKSGYVEGKNVVIEDRAAEGHYDRLPALAADLVRRRVAVIVATPLPSALAAKQATATIPIVFWVGADPIRYGLAASLAHPGGNATGISGLAVGLIAKRLELLHELLPKSSLMALLANPSNPSVGSQSEEAKEAGRALGRPIEILQASTAAEIEAAFASVSERHVGGLSVGADGFFYAARWQIVDLAARHAVPVIYENREFVEAGGLASYGTNLRDSYRQLGGLTGKVLDGARPVDLPVMQPTNFELVINLKTADALGLTIPQSILARVDEVIE